MDTSSGREDWRAEAIRFSFECSSDQPKPEVQLGLGVCSPPPRRLWSSAVSGVRVGGVGLDHSPHAMAF